MSYPFRYWEMSQTVELLNPAADAAGRTSPYVSVSSAHKAYIELHIAQGNAATIQISVLQGQTSAGTNSKAVGAVPIVSNLDCSASDVLVSRTAAASYTTDAGTKNKIIMFEINPADCMDLANGFDHIAVSTGASNASNVTEARLILMPLRMNQQPPISTTGV